MPKVKNWKKPLRYFCAYVILIMCMSLNVYAEGQGLHISVKFKVPQTDFEYSTQLWQQENIIDERDFFLSLPHTVKNSNIIFEIEDSNELYIDDVKVENGESIEALAEGVHSVLYGDEQYSLRVLYLSDIPTIYIDTQSGSLEAIYADKEYKEQGYMTLIDGSAVEFDGSLEYIKGRGNNTWEQPKRPFNIKTVEKVNLFDMGESRKWSLLANYNDDTSLRNIIAFDLAREVGLTYTPQTQPVDVYINGEYMGNYTLTERVEIDDERIDIVDLEKMNEEVNSDIVIEETELSGVNDAAVFGSYKWAELPNDPRDITGGYLIGYELNYRYHEEISGFVSDDGQPIVIKSPEYASKEQVEYIRDYYQKMEDAVISDTGYNKDGKHYSAYIDVASMAKMYLLQEYAKNLDAGITSFYYYKNASNRLVVGPVWDMDKAFGTNEVRYNKLLSDPDGYWAADLPKFNNGGYTVFALFFKHMDFREYVVQQWINVFKPQVDGMLEHVDELELQTRESLIADKFRWTKGQQRSCEDILLWQADSVQILKGFITERVKFMDIAFSEERNYVHYRTNGGEGIMIDFSAYYDGEMAYIRGPEFSNGDKQLLSWNTNPYGYGDEYIPGQTYPITDDLVLYAQWKTGGIVNRVKAFIYEIFH